MAGVPGRPLAFDPYASVLVYEGALVGAVLALVLGSRAEVTRRRATVDHLLAVAGVAGSASLSTVLAEVLRAPGLQIIRPPVEPDPRSDLPVQVGDRLLAVVRHPGVVALEPAVRDDVAAAVRLVLLADERRAALDEQAVALKAAQRRMVTAQDQQRALTAAKLRSAVVAPLHAAASLLDGEVSRGDPETSAAVAVALGADPRRHG